MRRNESPVVSLRPERGDEHRRLVLGLREAAALVEGALLIIRHEGDAQVVFVFLLDLFEQLPADATALTVGPHQQIVDIGRHDAVVHGADEAA